MAGQRFKLEKIEVILTDCIREIQFGQATLADCLARYPSLRRELEPLLRMALNIQEPPAFRLEPDYKRAAKAQLLQQIGTAKQVNSWSWTEVFSFRLPPQLIWARVAVAVVIGVIVISLLGGGTTYAAQSSLPGETLYPIKTGTEEVRLWMVGDSSGKAELNLEFARTRLIELSKLAHLNSNKTELAIKGYRDNLKAANNNLISITDTSILTGVLPGLSLKLKDQISFCDSLVDAGFPDNLSLQEAAAMAVDQQIDILAKLARQDNLQAALINLDMMQNRLQQAQKQAANHQYQTMQDAMLQYQQFDKLGQQILQNAHNTQNQAAEIDNLNAPALQSYLEILAAISQQVPQGYWNIIETTRAVTIQFQNQAHYGSQDQSGPDGGTGPGTWRRTFREWQRDL